MCPSDPYAPPAADVNVRPATRLTEPFGFLNLQLAPDGLHELDGEQRVVSVPIHDIRGVELAHGFTGERLVIQWILGATVLALGIYVGAPALSGLVRSVRLGLIMPLFLLAFAGVIAWNSLRRGPHLRVRTRAGIRKLIVRGRHERTDIEAFLERIRAALALV